MEKELISNVILWHDGSIHIAMNNRKTVQCTNISLPEYLSDPVHFVNTAEDNFRLTTSMVNPKYEKLEKINGIVLASAYSNKEVTIFYTELLSKLFDKYNYPSNTVLSLADLNSKEKISDEKEFLLKFFLTTSRFPQFMTKLNAPLDLDPQYMSRYFQEILVALMHSDENIKNTVCVKEESKEESHDFIPTEIGSLDDANQFQWVTITVYADTRKLQRGTVSSWVQQGKFKDSKKENGLWYINLYEKPPRDKDGRRKGVRDKETGKKRVRWGSERDLQEYFHERALYSPELSKYIRTKEESDYYLSHKHRECEINGKPALIIDIYPDFVNPITGKTNAEVIAEGGSPVVPFEIEELSLFDQADVSPPSYQIYHLHHIGQRADSPLAIIPQSDHNSKEWSSILHPHAASDEDIHGKAFQQIERPNFWKSYLRLYEFYGGYKQIPKRDPKRKQRNKRADQARIKEDIMEAV